MVKAVVALALLAAVIIGFAMPAPKKDKPVQVSQIPTIAVAD